MISLKEIFSRKNKISAENNGDLVKFTPREKEVAVAMIQCSSMKRAARVLGISYRTIDYHCNNIRIKMKENKTISAILKAYECGYIQ